MNQPVTNPLVELDGADAGVGLEVGEDVAEFRGRHSCQMMMENERSHFAHFLLELEE